MNANALRMLLDFVFILSTVIWLGIIFCLNFLVFPSVAALAKTSVEERLIRALLVKAYRWTALSGSIALPCLVIVPLAFPEFRGPSIAVQSFVLIICILLMLLASNGWASRTSNSNFPFDSTAGFQIAVRLRQASFVNMLVMALGVIVLAGFVARPLTRSVGIQEPGPIERTRLEWEAMKKQREVSERVLSSKNKSSAEH